MIGPTALIACFALALARPVDWGPIRAGLVTASLGVLSFFLTKSLAGGLVNAILAFAAAALIGGGMVSWAVQAAWRRLRPHHSISN
jgi:hypothetical protein